MYEREYVCIFSLYSSLPFYSFHCLFHSVLTSLYEEGDWQPKSSYLLFFLSPIRSQNCLVIILVHLGVFVKIYKVVKVINQPLIPLRPISSFSPIFYSPLFFFFRLILDCLMARSSSMHMASFLTLYIFR